MCPPTVIKCTMDDQNTFTPKQLARTTPPPLPLPEGSQTVPVKTAELATSKYRGGEVSNTNTELVDVPYLSHDREGDIDKSNYDQDIMDYGAASTIRSESTMSRPEEEEDHVALKVGFRAHKYLEERFSTDVSSMYIEKFHGVPEIDNSDITKYGPLGTGGFSDVFEVVCRSRHLIQDRTNNNASSCNIQPKPGIRRRIANIFSRSTPAATSNNLQLDYATFAMKCLRPQIRSDAGQFFLAAVDQVRETVILANLEHPHIVKLHGRASGHLTEAFSSRGNGYFILLDRLNETLNDRIALWKRTECILDGPTLTQFDVAHSIADAMAYLHSKDIVFRDLKPCNVGFDHTGVLKLFDFGSAMGLPQENEGNPSRVLYEKCGTPRYMAPEVALSHGYRTAADVYSFGVLLWEICAWTKPFPFVTSPDDLERVVCAGGERPVVKARWPETVKELMRNCWSGVSSERPRMSDVESSLSLAISNIRREAETSTKVIKFKRR
mmetsp:Transcript_24904/g.47759  ORF Transcript_24904/g.47759 Transcript_24904/m.47759 type:complete len:495 (+) Transcript_24904:260-1744(+)